jgi:hypothetical protein
MMRFESGRKLQAAGWVVQLLLVMAFGAAGAQKLALPIAALAPQMSFVLHVPEGWVRFIGLAEAAGPWVSCFRGCSRRSVG